MIKMPTPLILLAYLVLSSLPVQALDGWNMSFNDHSIVYTPQNLATGKTFEYTVFGPFDLNGADFKAWFEKRSRAMQESLGTPLRKWRLIREKEAWSVSNLFVNSQGVRMSVTYHGGTLTSGDAYIVRKLANN